MEKSDRELGRIWFEQVWNQGRREAIGEIFAPDIVVHDADKVSTGSLAFYQFFDRIVATFSEIHAQVEDTIAEGDKLCVRWSFTGRHVGDGLGPSPTGMTIRTSGITILRVADGRFVESWQNWDMLGLMEQLKGLEQSATYVTEA